MSIYKILIIGYGSIGKKHAIALKEHQISLLSSQKNDNFNCFSSLEEINFDELDYIIISNPTAKHYKTLSFINENAKNKKILIEKPLFEKPYKISQKNGNIFYIAYLLRFHPILQEIKQLIKNEEIYQANIICSSYLPLWRENVDYRQNYSAIKELGGGVLLDLSHEIDYAFWLFGDLDIKYSFSAKISDLEIQTDDLAVIFAQNHNKAQIYININYFNKIPIRQILIDTKNFSIKADLIRNQMQIIDKNQTCQRKTYQTNTIEILKTMHKNILKDDKTTTNLIQAQKIQNFIQTIKDKNE